ncbi:ferrochelatase [Corynebacterium tapiri]|uniref:Coproporphyrin III ferrochelatase n=1 Tax=Corynebacterium tapiri TaxID=1448266 RepID=A0A5C4U3M7_9CORY|nr:ferrochelatase [Corynebacterium tapiri]TNL97591.1 ferrochelatase [Corynebacterium tapiri]
MTIRKFDSLLVLSFGGPERPEEVVPFLRNVTRGRNIPDERLEIVGEHYYHFGGKSPLNELNLEIIDNLRAELEARHIDLPVYFGNRNWHPFAQETVEQMVKDGVQDALVLATSAWGGYSACLQYQEDIQGLREIADSITFTKLRQFFDHPLFIEEMAEAVEESFSQVAPEDLPTTKLLFTAHSVPSEADNKAGGEGDKNLYSRQVAEASRLVAQAAGITDYDVVWQSRSGNPATPWLEPDVVDHTKALAQGGISDVVVCPIGFISDHMEVIWDLDTELVSAAQELGVSVHRTRTAGPSERFSRMVVDLIDELSNDSLRVGLGAVSVQGCTVNGHPCRPGCCSAVG